MALDATVAKLKSVQGEKQALAVQLDALRSTTKSEMQSLSESNAAAVGALQAQLQERAGSCNWSEGWGLRLTWT